MKYIITITLALMSLALNACGNDPEGEAFNAKVWACVFEMSDEAVANLNGLSDADGKARHEACVAHVKGEPGAHLMSREEWEEAREAQRLEDKANGLNY